MKKSIIFIIFITIITVILSHAVSAATPTSTSSPTKTASPSVTPKQSITEADLDRIQKIKDMVAKKVAQLKLVEKRGFLGKVKEVSNTQITIENVKHDTKKIDIDELTKFQESAGSSKTFGVSDIKTGDELTFIGLYNKATKHLLARVITRNSAIPIFFEGVVAGRNAPDFSLTVVDEAGNKKTVDIESTTKTLVYSKDSNTSKSGYSKILVGQRVVVIGFMDKLDNNKIIASRVIHFTSDIPPSEEMKKHAENLPAEAPSTTPTPTKKAIR